MVVSVFARAPRRDAGRLRCLGSVGSSVRRRGGRVGEGHVLTLGGHPVCELDNDVQRLFQDTTHREGPSNVGPLNIFQKPGVVVQEDTTSKIRGVDVVSFFGEDLDLDKTESLHSLIATTACTTNKHVPGRRCIRATGEPFVVVFVVVRYRHIPWLRCRLMRRVSFVDRAVVGRHRHVDTSLMSLHIRRVVVR